MRRRDVLRCLGLGWISGLALGIRTAAAHQEPSHRTPARGRRVVQIPAPTFTLTDQDGQPFAFQAWRGRVVGVTFGYTRCPDVCPLLAAHFALIQQELPEAERARTGLLFITTDPERDTPAVLREYGSRVGADFATWKFLTGAMSEVGPVWRGFGVSVKKFGPARVDHTTLTTLVDGAGLRRVDYYGTRWEPHTLMRDLVTLAHGDVSRL
jgi:protein SCO1/2